MISKNKKLCLILVFTLLFNILSLPIKRVQAVTIPSVSYTLSSNDIKVGDSFTISVNLKDASDIYGASLDFKYDSTLLEITSVDNGSIFTSSGKTILTPINTSATKDGNLSYALLIQGNTTGISTDSTGGTIIIIHAKSLKEGSINLKTTNDNSDLIQSGNNIRLQLSNSNGDAISYNSVDKLVDIKTSEIYSAQYSSDTIPTTMVAGQSYNVSITMKNTGNLTWTEDQLYRLGAVEHSDPFYNVRINNYPRIVISNGASVAPGESYTFSCVYLAPSSPGSYVTDWQMVRDNVAWFGSVFRKTVSVVAPIYGAQYISDTITTSMEAGKSYNVSITMKNTGNITWTENQLYRLGAVDHSDPFYNIRINNYPRIVISNGASVAPGESYTFSCVYVAPSSSGSYVTDWQMVRDNVAWFGSVFRKTVSVTPSTNVVTYGAQYISDTIPTSMEAGKSYNVSITMKNTGNGTWTENQLYRLGAVDHSDPFYNVRINNYPRIVISNGASVAPGESYTFSCVYVAPSSSGSYVTDWQMVRDNVAWFGSVFRKTVSVTPSTNVVTYGAQYISDTIPTSMEAGKSYNVSITMKNTGNGTWTENQLYRLGAVDHSDPFYNIRINNYPRIVISNGASVAPGESYTFFCVYVAPSSPGSYVTDWQMVRDNVAWFGSVFRKTVSVVAPIYGAQYISDTIPTSMEVGKSYNVSITMKNTGNGTWTEAQLYRLGAVEHSDPFYNIRINNYPRIVISNGVSVAPGESYTFSCVYVAPSSSGSYVTDWQMVRDNVAWFGSVFRKTVSVTPSTNVVTYGAQYISDTIPTSMEAGKSYNVSITMKNTGNGTWTEAQLYRLGAVEHSDPFYNIRINNYPRIVISNGSSVAPGESYTFSCVYLAPTSPGSYVTDWQMVRDNVAWFGSIFKKTVSVK